MWSFDSLLNAQLEDFCSALVSCYFSVLPHFIILNLPCYPRQPARPGPWYRWGQTPFTGELVHNITGGPLVVLDPTSGTTRPSAHPSD